eukprot:86935-Prymnesium_polylepis.1
MLWPPQTMLWPSTPPNGAKAPVEHGAPAERAGLAPLTLAPLTLHACHPLPISALTLPHSQPMPTYSQPVTRSPSLVHALTWTSSRRLACRCASRSTSPASQSPTGNA